MRVRGGHDEDRLHLRRIEDLVDRARRLRTVRSGEGVGAGGVVDEAEDDAEVVHEAWGVYGIDEPGAEEGETWHVPGPQETMMSSRFRMVVATFRKSCSLALSLNISDTHQPS